MIHSDLSRTSEMTSALIPALIICFPAGLQSQIKGDLNQGFFGNTLEWGTHIQY